MFGHKASVFHGPIEYRPDGRIVIHRNDMNTDETYAVNLHGTLCHLRKIADGTLQSHWRSYRDAFTGEELPSRLDQLLRVWPDAVIVAE